MFNRYLNQTGKRVAMNGECLTVMYNTHNLTAAMEVGGGVNNWGRCVQGRFELS